MQDAPRRSLDAETLLRHRSEKISNFNFFVALIGGLENAVSYSHIRPNDAAGIAYLYSLRTCLALSEQGIETIVGDIGAINHIFNSS